jgi:hypothetical protein
LPTQILFFPRVPHLPNIEDVSATAQRLFSETVYMILDHYTRFAVCFPGVASAGLVYVSSKPAGAMAPFNAQRSALAHHFLNR